MNNWPNCDRLSYFTQICKPEKSVFHSLLSSPPSCDLDLHPTPNSSESLLRVSSFRSFQPREMISDGAIIALVIVGTIVGFITVRSDVFAPF